MGRYWTEWMGRCESPQEMLGYCSHTWICSFFENVRGNLWRASTHAPWQTHGSSAWCSRWLDGGLLMGLSSVYSNHSRLGSIDSFHWLRHRDLTLARSWTQSSIKESQPLVCLCSLNSQELPSSSKSRPTRQDALLLSERHPYVCSCFLDFACS